VIADRGNALRVAAVMTSHERREKTLRSIGSVHAQRDHDAAIELFLVDAGSTDGTVETVTALYPDVDVARVGSEVYWNQGMRAAFERARRTDPDHYLWLNDDTVLDDDAVAALLATEREFGGNQDREVIVVGTTRDPRTGRPTYGGVRRANPRRPLMFELVEPTDRPRQVETMNGNCVLVPRRAARTLGNLEPRFTHGMGDFDYGLRARSAGIAVWIAPGTVGTCARNPQVERTTKEEIRSLVSPKGLPPAEWWLFTKRWAGPLWPLYFVSPYVRRVLRRLGRSPRHGSSP
jgi:GT2 family glycosyltransferase